MNIETHQIPFTFLLSSKLKICSICFCLFLSHHLQCQQEDYSFYFSKIPTPTLVDSVGKILDVSFNYTNSVLPLEEFTFSISGNRKEILDQLFSLLDRNYVKLEDGLYAIQNRSLEREKLKEPPLISGHILDPSGITLPFVSIEIVGLDLWSESNEEGYFEVNKFLADEQLIRFSYLGYESRQISVKLLLEHAKPKIFLQFEKHILGEIVIQDFLKISQSDELKKQDKISLNKIDIAGTGDKDILTVAQTLPGVYSSSESLGELQIRGGPPDQTSYKWNSIQLFQNSLYYGKVSAVNPFLVDKIRITRNGASAEESAQASGAIILSDRTTIEDSLRAYFYSDLLYFNVGLAAPIIKDKLSFKLGYRKSHSNYYQSDIFNTYFDQIFQLGILRSDEYYIGLYGIENQVEIEQSFGFSDLSGVVNGRLGKRTNFKLSMTAYGNKFQYQYFDGLFDEFTRRDQLSLDNLGYSFLVEHNFSKKLKLKAHHGITAYSNSYRFDDDIDNPFSDNIRISKNTIDQSRSVVDLYYNSKKLNLSVGVQRENWDLSFIDTTRNDPFALFYNKEEEQAHEWSAHASVIWKFIPRVNIETGLRYSDYSLTLQGRKFYEPRFHISYLVSNNFTLHGHYGHFHQNLNRRNYSNQFDVEKGVWYLSDEFPDSDNFIWVVQNKQYSLGAQMNNKNWKVGVDVYKKKAENIWTSALDFSVEEDPFAFADLYVNGMEFSTQYRNAWLKLLWTYDYTDERLSVKNNDVTNILSPFTQKHRVSFFQSMQKGNFTLSSRWRYASGRYYSEGLKVDKFFFPDDNFQYFIEYSDLLNKKVKDFHALDVSLYYKWEPSSLHGSNFRFGLHAFNIYNRENIIKNQYFIDYTKTPFELGLLERKGLPFTPNISLEFNF